MSLDVNRWALLAALDRVRRVAKVKSKEISAGRVLVEAIAGVLVLRAGLTDEAVAATVSTIGDDRFALTVPAFALSSALRTIEDDTVALEEIVEGKADRRLSVRGSTAHREIIASRGAVLPAFPSVADLDCVWRVQAEDLRRAIRAVASMAAEYDDPRRNLSLLHCMVAGDSLVLEATNGFRLARMAIPLQEGAADGSSTTVEWLLSAATARRLAHSLTFDLGTVDCYAGAPGTMAVFRHVYEGDLVAEYALRLADGNYPALAAMGPANDAMAAVVRVDAGALLARVKSVVKGHNLLGSGNAVTLAVQAGFLQLIAEDDLTGRTVVIFPSEVALCAGDFDDACQKFNFRFLIDALTAALPWGEVVIALNRNPNAPATFECENAGPLHVLMPMHTFEPRRDEQVQSTAPDEGPPTRDVQPL